MFCIVLLVGTVSAADFIPIKQYDELTKTVTIVNSFGLGRDISTIQLNTPLNYKVGAGYNKVAELEIELFDDTYNNAFNKMDFYNATDMEEINRDFDYKYLTTELVDVNDYKESCSNLGNGTQVCENILSGTHQEEREVWKDLDTSVLTKGKITIGIFTDVQVGDYVEWIPTLFGKEIDEWATWTASLNVDLRHYYKLDEQDITGLGVIIDELGTLNGVNDGTINITGKINTAYNFTLDDSIQLGSEITYTKFSISAWIKPTLGTTEQVIVGKDNTGDRAYRFFLLGATNELYFQWGVTNVGSGIIVQPNEWSHVVITFDDATNAAIFYVNGTQSIKVNAGAGDFASSKLYIGAAQLPGVQNFFNGTIDELGFWNKTLTNGEVTILYNGGDGLGYLTGVVVSLNSPIDNFTFYETYSNLALNITTDSIYGTLTNISFYTNLTGAWEVTETINLSPLGISTSTIIFNITLSVVGDVLWGAEACDDGVNCKFASNRTLHFAPTILGICNATLTIPYINLSFKDEETNSYMNATIDTSTWEYWLGDGTLTKSLIYSNTSVNYNYTFCLSASNDTMHNIRSVQYASPGYPQRTYSSSSDLTNSSLNQTLYLLATGDGIYSTINVIDQAIISISGAGVKVERQFAGVWTTIGEDITDDAGSVTFWVNPDYDHRFTFTDDDCTGVSVTIRPTQSTYTQQLACVVGDGAEYTSPYKGLVFSFTPKTGVWLEEKTKYAFTFNISANESNLVTYFINITDENMNQLNSTLGTTAIGSNLTVTLDTTGYKKLLGFFSITITNSTGVYVISSTFWPVLTIEAGSGSLVTFFQNFKLSDTDIEDRYGILTLIFFIIFVGFAAFCYSTGMELAVPGISLFILFFLVLALSILGIFTIPFTPINFINKYGILLVVFFLVGGHTIGTWAKT